MRSRTLDCTITYDARDATLSSGMKPATTLSIPCCSMTGYAFPRAFSSTIVFAA